MTQRTEPPLTDEDAQATRAETPNATGVETPNAPSVESPRATRDDARPVRRRGAPWLLGGLVLALLFMLVALQFFGLWEFITPDTTTDTLLIYALSSLNFVAFVVFSFIFVRNLLKLRRERRERQLGSKIKTRLVVYFIAVSLLPITALAVFSYLFLNRSLEKWFSSLPEAVFQQAREVQGNEERRQAVNLDEIAAGLAPLLDGQTPEVLQLKLAPLAEQMRLSALGVVFANAPAAAVPTEVLPGRPANITINRDADPVEFNNLLTRLQDSPDSVPPKGMRQGDKLFDLSVATFGVGNKLVVARARRPDPQLAELVNSSETFENFKRRQRKVRLLGLSTLGLLTLMLLFAATWSAIHLARGIGTPIRTLAEAADEVARGNFSHRVSAITDDELGLLADSFNQMTAQLEENSGRLESNADELEANSAELREKNLALGERRNYIETVLESLSTGVVSLDAADRVTTINAAAVSMLRLGEAPRAGSPLAGLLVAEDTAALEKIIRRARRAGRAAWQMELSRGTQDDTGDGAAGTPVALTATALGAASDAGRGVVLVIEDLTELLAAQRAAAWSEVARRMAHEIKNPLTPIQLSAERIARQFRRATGHGETRAVDHAGLAGEGDLRAGVAAGGDESTGVPRLAQVAGPLDLGAAGENVLRDAELERVGRVVEDCTATITREVAGLKAMVDEFSQFSRLPHARLEPSDLNEVVRQAVKLYEDRLEATRLDVLLAHTLPHALLDPEQLRRVLVNLIDNALEALPDDAADAERRVTIATGHDPARGLLLVEVADTGHGISRHDTQRLFQPYFSTRGRGTGLGLAIVQRIVSDHGGRIRAESNHPRGARFIVELPVADETQRSEARGQRPEEEQLSSSSPSH